MQKLGSFCLKEYYICVYWIGNFIEFIQSMKNDKNVAIMTLRNKARMVVKLLICNSIAATGTLHLYRRFRRPGTLVILMYHKINNQEDPLGLTITPDFFREQIKYLVEQYTVISLEEAVSRLKSDTINQNYVAITFDDGYRDNYTFAYPTLQRYKVPVTIFVTHDAIESGTIGWYRFDAAILRTDRKYINLSDFDLGHYSLATYDEKAHAIIELHRYLKKVSNEYSQTVISQVLRKLGNPGADDRIMLSWAEIREMLGSGLIAIGSHTLTHPILTQVSCDIALTEICESKRLLEEKIGRPVKYFAYPNGSRSDFNEKIIAMTKGCGYEAACSTVSSSYYSKNDLYSLPRMDVTGNICRGICGGFSRSMFSVNVSGMLDGFIHRY
jgi:peptidoglycan/xylan/chitin deacetylase (PgdA/CDA1 family)